MQGYTLTVVRLYYWHFHCHINETNTVISETKLSTLFWVNIGLLSIVQSGFHAGSIESGSIYVQ